MRYNKGAPLVITKGVYTGASGWVIENDNPEREKLGTPYLVGFEHFDFGEGSEWFSEDYLMHLDELQKLQVENERLKAAINQVLQFFLPEDTEGAIEVLYAVMESETK